MEIQAMITDHQRDNIKNFCHKYGNITIKQYTIKANGSVNIDGNMCIYNHDKYSNPIPKFPFKINTITGKFHCIEIGLTTLENFPEFIGGDFLCCDKSLPSDVNHFIISSTPEDVKTFLKYQNHCEVWTPEFNKDNFDDLVVEISEGLR